MADKKLSDVTSVEDFDYFLGVKSNGDVQKMSKDSMKKVISELMSSFLQINSPKNFIVSNPSDMETGIISIGDASREISKSEKLNEPSEDIPFIRGMDSNGNPIYIGTEQFSSVLAGLMPVASNNVKGLVAGSSSNFANPKRIYGSTDEVLIGTSLVKGSYCSLLIDIEFYNGRNNTLYHVDAGKSEGDLTANKICGVLSCTFRKDSAGKVYVNGVGDCMIAVVVLSSSDSFSF